jgi:hypothetical protein
MNALNLPRTLLACSLLMALSGCGAPDTAPAGMQEHGEAEAADHERGPHRGRLLRDGDFALELKITTSTCIRRTSRCPPLRRRSWSP